MTCSLRVHCTMKPSRSICTSSAFSTPGRPRWWCTMAMVDPEWSPFMWPMTGAAKAWIGSGLG